MGAQSKAAKADAAVSGTNPFTARDVPARPHVGTSIAWPVLAAVGAVFLFWAVMRFSIEDLRVPFTYSGDALHVLALVKGLGQGQWPWYNASLGAPYGADMRDFPLTMAADMSVMKGLIAIFHSPALVANLYWIFSIAACAALATYALMRLDIRPGAAACLGIIYALQPFTFYRGIHHLSLVFHFVPLIAVGAIELVAGRIQPEFEGAVSPLQKIRRLFACIPAYLYVSCVLQGFAHIYNAFFACFLLATAAAIGAVSLRRRAVAVVAGVLITIIGACTVITLTPSLLFWRTHGKRVDYKRPAEAEVYGMKIRHLLTPIPDHPIPYFRKIAAKIQTAAFPHENENTGSKLGIVGSIGFLLLLGYALIRCAGPQWHDPVLGPSAALAMAIVLLATVGGFSALFNVFVSPDIRAYNRIVVFLSFFCLAAVGTLVSRKVEGLRLSSALRLFIGIGACIITATAVADQASTSGYRNYAERRASFEQDAYFVAEVERVVGPDAMILQLPFTDFPVDPGIQRLEPYEHAKAYLHSKRLKWSWGAMAVRDGAWNAETANLPTTKMLPLLAAANIKGLWIDVEGYPLNSSPVQAIAETTGTPPIWSPNRQVAFFNLQEYIARVHGGTSAADQQRARIDALQGVRTEYQDFDPEEAEAERRWRWCSGDCTVVLRNPAPISRKVSFVATLQTGSKAGAPVLITTSGITERLIVPSATRLYRRVVELAPESSVTIHLQTDAPLVLPPPARPMRLAVLNPSVSTNE